MSTSDRPQSAKTNKGNDKRKWQTIGVKIDDLYTAVSYIRCTSGS